MKENKIRFYKGTHTYRLGKSKLESVTTFVNKHFPPFEAKKIARMLAGFWTNKQKKRGVRYWLKEWKLAAQHGTDVHWLMEQEIKDKVPESINSFEERTRNKYIQGCLWLEKFDENEYDEFIQAPELIMYDEELGLAGTIDLAVFSGKKVTLIDWKTNKKISKDCYGKKGYKVLKDMDASNINKYSLQLTMYAYMLERKGWEIDKLILVHLMEDKYKEYEIPYETYKIAIKEMIKNEQNRKEETSS